MPHCLMCGCIYSSRSIQQSGHHLCSDCSGDELTSAVIGDFWTILSETGQQKVAPLFPWRTQYERIFGKRILPRSRLTSSNGPRSRFDQSRKLSKEQRKGRSLKA